MAASEILLACLLILALGAFGVVLFRYVARKSEVATQVQTQLEKWRETELHALRQQYHEMAQQEAAVQLQHWRQELERDIQKDAIDKSRTVTIGSVRNHPNLSLRGEADRRLRRRGADDGVSTL